MSTYDEIRDGYPEDMTPGEYNDAVRETLSQLDGTEETAAAFVSRRGPYLISRNTATAQRFVSTVPDASNVVVTAAAPITHLCPHKDEVDNGRIHITWRCEGNTIELHTLAHYLSGFARSRISHEQVTDRIAHYLAALPGLTLTSVSSEWNTAGMEVSCSTSQTPVVTP